MGLYGSARSKTATKRDSATTFGGPYKVPISTKTVFPSGAGIAYCNAARSCGLPAIDVRQVEQVIKYRHLRSYLFGNGIDDSQLPHLTKRSVSPLMHFAGTALRHHHEVTAGQVLHGGSTTSGRLDQFYRRDIGVNIENRDLTGSGEEVIDLGPSPAADVPVPCGDSIKPAFPVSSQVLNGVEPS